MRATLCLAIVWCWIGCSSNSPAPNASDGAAGLGSAGHDGASDARAGDVTDGSGVAGSSSDAVSGTDGAPDSNGPSDAAGDGADAPATMCPTAQPAFGATCMGTLSCQYGKSSCCGIESSARTCTCQFGFFDCQQTVECNFTCPSDGGAG